MEVEVLEAVFNHLVLPPKLPGHRDANLTAIEQNILGRLKRAVNTLSELTDPEYEASWTLLHKTLRSCARINVGGLERTQVQEELSNLEVHDLLILYVVEQNAALLVRRRVCGGINTVIFEVSETSPSSEVVLAAENALQWDFPGRAVEIPLEEFLNQSFLGSLATFLEQASMEPFKRFEAQSTKANVQVNETRDTTDPALISQMLMPLLEAVGSAIEVPRIRKRVRDDVVIENAELPWRRLPLWLILRVSIQRQLCILMGDGPGRAYYKFLICDVLTQLLRDSANHLSPEVTLLLRSKLCRRLSKLELEKKQVISCTALYNHFFQTLEPKFRDTVQQATSQTELAWTRLKASTTRSIPPLPLHASDEDLLLVLPNSKHYINNILGLTPWGRRAYPSLEVDLPKDSTMDHFAKFAERYFALSKLETDIAHSGKPSIENCETHCRQLAASILEMFTTLGDAYDSNPEQISIFILNVFDLWVQMDKCAAEACPLLAEYAPVFKPELLDVLHLPTQSSMKRLQEIQHYLHDRTTRCCLEHKTIFSEPDADCFAMRYVAQSSRLLALQQRIEETSDASREFKESEWERLCEQYNALTQKIETGVCRCTVNDDGTRNVRGCKKCWHWRCRKKMTIDIHEDFLPKDSSQKAATILEIEMPPLLSAYRNATFKIFNHLRHKGQASTFLKPVMLLKDYPQLQKFAKPIVDGVTFASAKKSFLQTHFKTVKLKVELEKVLLPLGLNFAYYDSSSGVWLKDLNKPFSLQHLCGIHIPHSLRSTLDTSPSQPFPPSDDLSSYEIVASQPQCPANTSIHEFMGYQRLLSGSTRRWLTMLAELGASNMNFSAEDTMLVFNHLALQAGPVRHEANVLRDAHIVFQDPSFCLRLLEVVSNRLRNITTNWRETNCMELLTTLALRIFNLTSGSVHESAKLLLMKIRESTLQWTFLLREEVRNAVEADSAERAARYGFLAALLSRRTFEIFVDSEMTMSTEDLCSFVQASIALQENLVVDLAKLNIVSKNMLVRDLKMACQIRKIIQKSIESNPDALASAINKTWSDSNNSMGRTYSKWQFLFSPNNRWTVSAITSTIGGFSVSQTIQYNFVEGHLLLDGKPLGKLPLDIRNSEDVRELFGNQHLLTFPSPLKGMSHMMASNVEDNAVHFGLRGENVVIRTVFKNNVLEFIPRRVFQSNSYFDLPSSLLDGCVHWLNLRTKCVEVRRIATKWKLRINDWTLNMATCQARRNNSFLVDPRSEVFRRVARIFEHFEQPRNLTVFQPVEGKLQVEMRHLELSFVVNGKQLLHCRELNAEIDPNQDAGTLYGFLSKIVLRDAVNPERRSIITPLGDLRYKRHGIHVLVWAEQSNMYGKYIIDDVLGRLSCPPEPRLLYAKARVHAYTSFPLSDPLTRRTGTEEALHTLRSGYCQPWTGMVDNIAAILRMIGDLSPRREYYPKDKKRLQTVTWNEHLTASIQHDSYYSVVQALLTKASQLRAFNAGGSKPMTIDPKFMAHLNQRGVSRRLLYERKMSYQHEIKVVADAIYRPRDRHMSLPQATYVYQIVAQIREQSFHVHMTRKLSEVLESCSIIGGFGQTDSDISIPSSCLSDLAEKKVMDSWGTLISLCINVDLREPYWLLYQLALLSFGTEPDMDMIRLLAAFAYLDELKELEPPAAPCFTEFNMNESPSRESILNLIKANYPVACINLRKSRREQERSQEKHQTLCEAEGVRLASFILGQWPSAEVSVGNFSLDLLDGDLAIEHILPEWQRLHRNMKLSEYVMQIEKVMTRHEGLDDLSVPRVWNKNSEGFYIVRRDAALPQFSDLLSKNAPPLPSSAVCAGADDTQTGPAAAHSGISQSSEIVPTIRPSEEMMELRKLLELFCKSADVLRQQYSRDLMNSLEALESFRNQHESQKQVPSMEVVRKNIEKARTGVMNSFERVQMILSDADDRYQWLHLGDLWPCTTPTTTLEQLRSSCKISFGTNIKSYLLAYGVSITTLRRLLRIRHAQLKKDNHKLFQELQYTGHENWNVSDFPDWLLLEIDSDILIRPEQIDVAHAIISPASGANSVLQMNMGKGKSSCIVPMAIAVLADTKYLSRLVVPKALLLQTAQTVQSRLGGLVGREIRYIPFSRRTSTTPEMLQLYATLHREMLDNCGVILTTPEHILSYKLSGLQRLADSRLDEAKSMIPFQSCLTNISRDILDESDFTLGAKTQLIYPSGPQTSVDGHPQRWEIAQTLLSLVEDHLPGLQRDFARSLEVVKRPGGFPMVHLLRPDVEDALHKRIINDVCNGRMAFLRLNGAEASIVAPKLKRFLSEKVLKQDLLDHILTHFSERSSIRKALLLLRGMLFNGILLLSLKKRWNVQYGLHPKRQPIAVPFEAKGVPSEQAEFGHPDVSILFTCLAFYYSGLNIAQFRDSLQHVLKADDPSAEYDRWTSGCDSIPDTLLHWNVINADDQGQIEELWRCLRFDRNVLDHYMNNFVFPSHAKQFGIKLQASGWDLPLMSKTEADDKSSCARTTGFSGTNDNKMLLPLNIKQDDLPSLSQTNAEVLTYILQQRNREYNVAAVQGRRLTEEELLERIKAENIRVLIDAGAYILEMDNRTLVKKWLEIDKFAKGGVFFGDDNRAWVQYRDGKEVPLIATPYAEKLDECVVYIDEAHTRGTDLKLPHNARGALTLALGQTKDHTMQAAMRLRELGTTQSLFFFAPPEVHQSILDVCHKSGYSYDASRINSSHVVCWLLEQTCRANEQLQYLYLAQGSDYCRRTDAQWRYAKVFTTRNHREALLSVIQHSECQSLEELYGVAKTTQSFTSADMSSTKLKGFMNKLSEQRRHMNNTGHQILSSMLEEVEQEREVEFQIEQIRQVQKPPTYEALTFPGLQPDISNFIDTGSLTIGPWAEHIFDALAKTAIGQKYNVQPTTSNFYVSAEFMRTVKLRKRQPLDNFLRPVEWLLWCPTSKTALIVIAEEVELLIPRLRAAKKSMVHLITYAAPITKNMMHFNGLSYYVLPCLPEGHVFPDWLHQELGIFAGRLYLSFADCAPLKEYLQIEGNTDTATTEENSKALGVSLKNPAEFLLEWLTMCRKGQDIMHTPMGYICQGRPLHANHSFFVVRNAEERIITPISEERTEVDVDDEEHEEEDEQQEEGVEADEEGDQEDEERNDKEKQEEAKDDEQECD